MFAAIDQFAFSVLLMLSHLFGVTELPKEPSPDWQVVQNWKELPDKTYELILESTTIPKYCKDHPDHYVVFPQNQVGQYELWLSNTLVSTNSLSKRWNIRSLFSRDVVSCRKIITGSTIIYKMRAYLIIFATLKKYPYAISSYPQDNILYGPLFFVASGVCISLAFFGYLILLSIGSNINIIGYLFVQIQFGILMFFYHPGLIASMPVEYINLGVLFNLWCGIILFCILFVMEKNYSIIYVITPTLLLSIMSFMSGKYTTQLCIILPIFPIIIFIFYHLFKKIRLGVSKTDLIQFVIPLFVSCILGLHEAYAIFININHPILLPLIVMLFSWVAFGKLLLILQDRELQMQAYKSRIDNELKYTKKMEEIFDEQRQLIHDIKSPITSLNFILNKSIFDDSKIILKINQRLSVLLEAMNDKFLIGSPDWFSEKVLLSCVEEIVKEKCHAYGSLKINHCSGANNPGSDEVFFNPLFVKSILSELIDNSTKVSIGQLEVNISLRKEHSKNILIIGKIGRIMQS